MDRNELYIEKCMKAFFPMHLPEEQVKALETYLRGNGTEEFIDMFPMADLSHADTGSLEKLLREELKKKGNEKNAARLFHASFSVAQGVMHHWLHFYEWDLVFGQNNEINPAKKVALYTLMYAEQKQLVNGRVIEKIGRICDDHPGILVDALDAILNQTGEIYIYLLSLYFLAVYGNQYQIYDPAKKHAKKDSFLSRIGLFKTREVEAGVQIREEDKGLLSNLEDCVVRNLHSIIQLDDKWSDIQLLLAELSKEELSDEIIQSARKGKVVSEPAFYFAGVLCYLTFQCSDVLKNVLTLFWQSHTVDLMEWIMNACWSITFRNIDFCKYGCHYEELFHIDPENFIRGSLSYQGANNEKFLEIQYKKHPNEYKKVMYAAEASNYIAMVKAIQKVDPMFKEEKRVPTPEQKQKLVDFIVRNLNGPERTSTVDYLMGVSPISNLYPYIDGTKASFYGGYGVFSTLNEYLIKFQDEQIRKKTITLLALYSSYYFRVECRNQKIWRNQKTLDELLSYFKEENLELKYQLDALTLLMEDLYTDGDKGEWKKQLFALFQRLYKESPEELYQCLQEISVTGRVLGVEFYSRLMGDHRAEVLAFTADASKQVKEAVIQCITSHPDWEEEVLKLLAAKKAAQREIAVYILSAWENEGRSYHAQMEALLEKEKNAKVVTALQNVLQITDSSVPEEKEKTTEDFVKDIHKGGKKRQLSWIYDHIQLPQVHKTDGSLASEDFLQAICLYYMNMSQLGVNEIAKKLAEEVVPSELEAYANLIFEQWIVDGAQAKKKWILYYSAIHGGSQIVDKLHHYIKSWPEMSRGAIAAEAVNALALSPVARALMIVDSISRKFKFKQVKTAAAKALEFAATELGLTVEELADRIIPDFGFDENMERRFDYGERSFIVTISPELEISVKDENGKKLKNMPSPGKKDDEEKANAAYAEFKQLKKDMKATVSIQKTRLEMALSSERLWSIEDWKKLFVSNPIMHQFAIGLIWGIYEDHKLLQSFRYMEDGSFNTEDEDEYELSETGFIGLVHPIELTDDLIAAWKEQLADYEIRQPFEQMERPVFYVTEEEKNEKELNRFRDLAVSDLALLGKLTGMGWYRGAILDAGGYTDYYREDKGAGYGADLTFSGSCVGAMGDEVVTLEGVRFFEYGKVKRGAYEYTDLTDKNSVTLKDVPKRYFSEIILQLNKIK